MFDRSTVLCQIQVAQSMSNQLQYLRRQNQAVTQDGIDQIDRPWHGDSDNRDNMFKKSPWSPLEPRMTEGTRVRCFGAEEVSSTYAKKYYTYQKIWDEFYPCDNHWFRMATLIT